MEASVGSGYYGFGILPTGDMGVPFMSPEFLDHYRHAIDTAARLGIENVPVRRILVSQRQRGRAAARTVTRRR